MHIHKVSDHVVNVDGRDYGLGREHAPDDNDKKFTIWKQPELRVEYEDAPLFNAHWMPRLVDRLDQNGFPHCVGYSWTHWLLNGPRTQPNLVLNKEYADGVYFEAQTMDEWIGEDYEGSSVRGGAKALMGRKLVGSYYWAWDVETLALQVLTNNPVVVGTLWYNSMFRVLSNRFIEVLPSSGLAGGHAYLLNACRIYLLGGDRIEAGFANVDFDKSWLRIQNSWGLNWGFNGNARISLRNMQHLIEEDGEVAHATELKAA